MIRAAVIAAVVAAVSAQAVAQEASDTTRYEAKYRVKKNDSLALIAAEYYGSRKFEVFLMSVNKMDHKTVLRPGKRLRVPVPRTITAALGDTWAALAEQHLGDARRAKFLAQFNGLSEDVTLPAGSQLMIPYHMDYTAEADTKLSTLALNFLSDRNQGSLLKEYNFLERNSIAKGESIIIPFAAKVNVSKVPPLDAESSARRETRLEMQDAANTALPKARKAWRAGDYAEVKAELATIETGYLDTPQAVEVLVLLGCAHVAFSDKELAIAEFTKALSRDSSHKLSAYRFSPKIREIWKQAGGEVDETSRD